MSAQARPKARPRRRRVIRVNCDHLQYVTEDGEQAALRAGQWVEFRARITALDNLTLMEFGGMSTDGDTAALAGQFTELVAFLAQKIAAWSWLDIDGDYAPMPDPSVEVLGDLDMEDLMALFEMYAGLTQPSPKASSPS